MTVVVRKQWRNALRHGLSSSINHDVSSGDNIQSHSQAKLARSQGASVFFGGVTIEWKGEYGNESKELRGWTSVTAKISFMDLFGAGPDTLNNGISSCILDALTTIANILATLFSPPPHPHRSDVCLNFMEHNCTYFVQISIPFSVL